MQRSFAIVRDSVIFRQPCTGEPISSQKLSDPPEKSAFTSISLCVLSRFGQELNQCIATFLLDTRPRIVCDPSGYSFRICAGVLSATPWLSKSGGLVSRRPPADGVPSCAASKMPPGNSPLFLFVVYVSGFFAFPRPRQTAPLFANDDTNPRIWKTQKF
jgi:hypothetical protein